MDTLKYFTTLVVAMLLCLITMVACAYLWVYLYSIFIHTTGDAAHYEAYAQVASPVVAVVTAPFVFYVMGRFMRRYGDGALKAALTVVALNLVLDVMAVMSVADDLTYHISMSALSLLGKLAGSYLGSRSAGQTSTV